MFPASNPELVPRVLAGRWRIDALLGAGGMGQVFRATELATGRLVAVKLLSFDFKDSPAMKARFEREGLMLARLDHPSLVPLLAVDQDGDVPFIVMKFIEGKTLSSLLHERTRFALRQLLPLLAQLCSALDYLHARGVVHRDLKPRNIIVDSRDRLTLLDFGVSRRTDQPRLTEPGMVVGTPMYMAPEQILSDDSGPPADIYALALLAYHLLVGVHPFAGDQADSAIILRQIGELPELATSKNPAVPASVAKVLERSLRKQPELRHPTAMAFYEELLAAFGDDGTSIDQPLPVIPPPPVHAQPTKLLQPVPAPKKPAESIDDWLRRQDPVAVPLVVIATVGLLFLLLRFLLG